MHADRRRKPVLRALLGASLGLALLTACVTNPVTGRVGVNAFTIEQDVALGREAYAQTLEGAQLVTSGPELERVRRVMERITAVVDAPGFEWEVNLIKDDGVANAFALPGGKMAVYTGILPICQSEAGLAVVMGHEIGHVIARHGTERLTPTAIAGTLLETNGSAEYAAAVQGAIALLSLPNGRRQESDADHTGLIYMARAGYDPREAVRFWERMQGDAGGEPSSGGIASALSEFLATHPSHGTRIRDLEARMGAAMEEYRRATGAQEPADRKAISPDKQ